MTLLTIAGNTNKEAMPMQKIFFTADTHFGHENVIRFDKRPFASADEMDEEMIRRWNNKVGKATWYMCLAI